MKDILGKEIEVGDHILYIKGMADRNFEEAIVSTKEDNFIKIEYLGRGSEPKQWVKRMEAGKKSRLTVTHKNVIILGSNIETKDKDIFKMERERYAEEIKKLKKQIFMAHHREQTLTSENRNLQAEVDKINTRFDILDL